MTEFGRDRPIESENAAADLSFSLPCGESGVATSRHRTTAFRGATSLGIARPDVDRTARRIASKRRIASEKIAFRRSEALRGLTRGEYPLAMVASPHALICRQDPGGG
jgi:hypothetical protein